MNSISLWAAACLLAASVGAQTSDQPARTQDGPVAETISRLAERYDVSRERLAELREEGMGWGELGRILAVAEKADRPLEEIAELRRSGEGFDRIMTRYKLDAREVRREAARIEREGREAERLEPGHEERMRRRMEERGDGPHHERMHRGEPMHEPMRERMHERGGGGRPGR